MLKRTILLTLIGVSLLLSCHAQSSSNNKSQINPTTMEGYELKRENAHPKAQIVLKEDFYWDPIDEAAPFGNDDGADAFYGFREWRNANPTLSPKNYLNELLESWAYPAFDIYETDTANVQAYIGLGNQQDADMMQQLKTSLSNQGTDTSFNEKEFEKFMAANMPTMGVSYLRGINNAVIAVGFGQFILEGEIDNELKTLVQIAIKRELLPQMMEPWGQFKSECENILLILKKNLEEIK